MTSWEDQRAELSKVALALVFTRAPMEERRKREEEDRPNERGGAGGGLHLEKLQEIRLKALYQLY